MCKPSYYYFTVCFAYFVASFKATKESVFSTTGATGASIGAEKSARLDSVSLLFLTFL